jgi:hypothetical protein
MRFPRAWTPRDWTRSRGRGEGWAPIQVQPGVQERPVEHVARSCWEVNNSSIWARMRSTGGNLEGTGVVLLSFSW